MLKNLLIMLNNKYKLKNKLNLKKIYNYIKKYVKN